MLRLHDTDNKGHSETYTSLFAKEIGIDTESIITLTWNVIWELRTEWCCFQPPLFWYSIDERKILESGPKALVKGY